MQGYLQEFGTQGLCIATDFYGSDARVYPDGNYQFIYRLKNDLVKSGLSENEIDTTYEIQLNTGKNKILKINLDIYVILRPSGFT